MIYDVLIVGGGPIGIACALEAKKKNLSYIIIEKGTLVNSLYNYPNKMTFFSTSEKLELDDIPFVSNNPKPTKQEALEYYRRIVESKQIHINLFEKVEQVENKDKNFKVITSKTTYQSKNIVIATGFYDLPNYLNVPGEDLDKVTHYYDDPHYYATQNVVVVGASNSSVDAALETYRKGANVTMIVRGEQIGERVKYWVRPDVINRIKEGSITAHFNSEITEIGMNYVKFKDEDGNIQRLDNDFVLALTGYRPNFEFLESLGIRLSEDQLSIPEYNQQTMKTNVEGIYLAGVICGGMETHKWFIENSRIHAKMIMEDINA
jgi:putative YpdA family bacillithiol system oxidoreductase